MFKPSETKVCVIGLGYIGLPSASVLATKGFHVFGTEVREDVVEIINRGEIHIEEPDLDILVRSAVNSGQLKAFTEPQAADVFAICVPTPITENKTADLSFVKAACEAIKPHVAKGNLIILESTSPPGTTENIVAQHAIPDGFEIGTDVFVAHCPERVLPGRILLEVVQNDRVVGGMTANCTERAKAFYESFVHGEVLPTTAAAAETTKLVENAFRDVNIAFANELSIVADQLGVDVWDVIDLANRHPRVNILTPGPGVGGHCISVDPWFLVDAAPDVTPLMRTAREVNDSKPQHVVERICRLSKQFAKPKIGCLGLTYKANVDDLRESPSLEIVRELESRKVGQLLVCDPTLDSSRFTEFPLHSLDQVLDECNVLVLLTDHKPFYSVSKQILQEKVLIDTRGIWR
jgi:UDP-N-acetyl-D-mannosaminuronic acid dehydrogenase